MRGYDVVVVGGGPIGAVAARIAAGAGAHTLLVEKGDGSGDPVRCAGLLSPRVLPALGASGDCVVRKISGGVIHSPSGATISLRADTIKAVVVDRAVLNRELLSLARSCGVEVRTNTRVTAARRGAVSIISGRDEEDIRAGVIIGADGPGSLVASSFSLSPPKEMLLAIQATIVGPVRSDDEVDIFFGRSIAPTFFSWVIPAQEGHLRVGLAAPIGENTDDLLSRFLRGQQLRREIDRIRGVIPISLAPKVVSNGVLLVGDAAGQVKPSSGGGLYTGAVCARIAGEVAAEAALAGRTTRSDLAIYEQRFKEEIGGELRFGRAVRDLLHAIDDEGIDAVFGAIDRPAIKRLIERYGDIDYPSRLVHAIASRGDLWPTLRPLIPVFGGMDKLSEIAHTALAGDSNPYV